MTVNDRDEARRIAINIAKLQDLLLGLESHGRAGLPHRPLNRNDVGSSLLASKGRLYGVYGPHILVRELSMAVARYREENGKIGRKHGNILLRTRRENSGPGFATGRADHAKTNLVRDRPAPTIRPTPTSTRAVTTVGKAVPFMFDPFRPWKTSFALSLQVARMCWEPQAVIFLRCLRIAEGGAKAEAETTRMMTEKVASLAQGPVTATAAALNGSKKHGTAKKTVYARRVRRNRSRLSK